MFGPITLLAAECSCARDGGEEKSEKIGRIRKTQPTYSIGRCEVRHPLAAADIPPGGRTSYDALSRRFLVGKIAAARTHVVAMYKKHDERRVRNRARTQSADGEPNDSRSRAARSGPPGRLARRRDNNRFSSVVT